MIPAGLVHHEAQRHHRDDPGDLAEFGNLHPFAPAEQAKGYAGAHQNLEEMLCRITGFDAVTLQPNSGRRANMRACWRSVPTTPAATRHTAMSLIPSSAHGTSPASAQMCGMDVVVTKCDDNGNVDVADLRAAAGNLQQTCRVDDHLPVDAWRLRRGDQGICAIVHLHGGQVYHGRRQPQRAGVGVTYPAELGADVSHMNLHKTFCIPHGGGGPGVRPISVRASGAVPAGSRQGRPGQRGAVWQRRHPADPVRLHPHDGRRWFARSNGGGDPQRQPHREKLAPHFLILYTGHGGFVAHGASMCGRSGTCARHQLKRMDVAKRLMDYMASMPTVSFPVAGTLMIQSRPRGANRRSARPFHRRHDCHPRRDRAVETGVWPGRQPAGQRAAHHRCCSPRRGTTYAREQAAYRFTRPAPEQILAAGRTWDDVYGDRNIMCTCPPLESYAT